jgi:hypothetical protein
MSTSLLASRDRAQEMIEAVRKTPHGVWPHVSGTQLCDQLDMRVDFPDLINQRSTPFCESTSIVYGLASSDPAEYVKFVNGLFQIGQAHLKHWLVVPCKTVLHSNAFRRAGIDVADWIPTVSIRNAEDMLLPLGLPIPGIRNRIDFKGVTLAETAHEAKKAGFTDVKENLHRTVEALHQANHWLHKKYIVCLGINAQLLKEPPSKLKKLSHHSDHRVVLRSKIHIESNWIADDTIHLKVFSWGDEKRIPPSNFTGKQEALTVDDFLQNYRGFVAFKF